MKALIALAMLVSSAAFAANSYDCSNTATGQRTIDAFTLVKLQNGANATVEFHPVGAHKGWDLSPTISAVRGDRAHHPADVQENGTSEFTPVANPQEFNKAIAPKPGQPVYVSAIFVSQGLLQDKSSGYVKVEYRYDMGSGAGMHSRQYLCTVK
jgi:hypothetical protein